MTSQPTAPSKGVRRLFNKYAIFKANFKHQTFFDFGGGGQGQGAAHPFRRKVPTLRSEGNPGSLIDIADQATRVSMCPFSPYFPGLVWRRK